jgi:hypothetical protein
MKKKLNHSKKKITIESQQFNTMKEQQTKPRTKNHEALPKALENYSKAFSE